MQGREAHTCGGQGVLAPRGGSELCPHLPPPFLIPSEGDATAAPEDALTEMEQPPALRGAAFWVPKVVPGVPRGQGQAQHLGCELGEKFCKRKWPGLRGEGRKGRRCCCAGTPGSGERSGRELGGNWERTGSELGALPLPCCPSAAAQGGGCRRRGKGRVTRHGCLLRRNSSAG